MDLNFTSFALMCLLGVVAGILINEIVARLPVYLYRGWQGEAREILGLPADQLSIPAFQNPHSRTRRLLVAVACGLLTTSIAYQLNLTMEGFTFITLTWALVALSLIDADHKILPDIIVLPLLWAGLIVNNFGFFTTSSDALWGAIGGYTSMWSVYWLLRLATGKEGIGHGDFKLLSGIGAWGGWQILPFTVILAALLGVLVYLFKRFYSDEATDSVTIPFGPYLSLAGWIGMLYWMHAPFDFS